MAFSVCGERSMANVSPANKNSVSCVCWCARGENCWPMVKNVVSLASPIPFQLYIADWRSPWEGETSFTNFLSLSDILKAFISCHGLVFFLWPWVWFENWLKHRETNTNRPTRSKAGSIRDHSLSNSLSLFSDKDGRTDGWMRWKNTAKPCRTLVWIQAALCCVFSLDPGLRNL